MKPQLGVVLASIAIWRVKQQMEDLSLGRGACSRVGLVVQQV